MNVHDSLAIVVIGRNEGDRLRASLRSAMKDCPYVVYADSASSDGSTDLARSMGAVVVSVDASKPLNAARGRNAGLDVIRQQFTDCRYVQFMDGDCILVDRWLEVALEFLESNPQVAVACGRRFEAHPTASLYNRLADEEWNTPVGLVHSCGGDAMMRISALDEVGGFNPSLMASEEPELAARLRRRRWEIWRLDMHMTEHDARILTFAQWWRRTTRSGYGYAQAWLSTRTLAEPVNQKLLTSALLWVAGVPVALLLLAIASRHIEVVVALPFIYAAQILRLALRREKLSTQGLKSSCMIMLAKVPELIGATRAMLGSNRPAVIEYKNPPAAQSGDAL